MFQFSSIVKISLVVLLVFILNKAHDHLFVVNDEISAVDIEHFCASGSIHQHFLENPYQFSHWNELEEEYAKSIASPQNKAPILYTLPVVVHIIHQNGTENISDALVSTGIQHLNDAFANEGYYDQGTGVDTEIQFCLASRDPDGNATSGINRVVSPYTNVTLETEDDDLKDVIRWNPTHYINIWVVDEICSNVQGCGVAGYAYFPSSHGNPEDGLVVEARWFGSSPSNSSVITHEIGHYLGLYHTFEGGCPNGDCLQNGDRVCDTPPDQSIAASPCSFPANTCDTDVNLTDPNNPFTTDQDDMIINYMDYGDWDCYSAFTFGQKDRMVFYVTGTRSSLLNSLACIDPCMMPLTANFLANPNPVSAGETINFTNESTGATIYEWYVDGVLFSNDANAQYNFTDEGNYQIVLSALNADPNCMDNDTLNVQVICPVVASFIPSSFSVRPGDAVIFTNTSENGITFEWFVEDVLEGTSTGFEYDFAAEGNYQITLVANNGICSDTSAAIIITVNEDGLAQTGLPVWPQLINQGENVQSIDWRSLPPIVGEVTGDGNDVGAYGQTGAAFDECGRLAFFAVHTGDTNQNQLYIYGPNGTPLLTDVTPNAPGLNAVKGGNEIQVIPVPETGDQWYIIYSEWSSSSGAPLSNAAYNPARNLYAKVQLLDANTLLILERDIVLTDDNGVAYVYTDGKAVSRTANGDVNGHYLYLCRRAEFVNTLSLDRFLISNSGINFDANTGPVDANWWYLTIAGSPIELSPTEEYIAVVNRNQYDNWADVLLFDAIAFNNINVESISAGDLVLQADGTSNDISNVLPNSGTVNSIANNISYPLSYLRNYEKKLNGIEFSPNGRFLYLTGGGFVAGSTTNLTYLSQIDLESDPMEVRMQIQEPPFGSYTQSSGGGCTYSSSGCLDNYYSITHIESCYDGNLYFIKRNGPDIFVIPNPNNILPQNLVPSDIDLSTPEEPNITGFGRPAYIPDQIDGYNYLDAQYREVTLLVNNQDCDGDCANPYAVDVTYDGNIVESYLLNTCPDTIVFCADTSLVYGLSGPNDIVYPFAIAEAVVIYPAGSTVFDFSDNSDCIEVCNNNIDDDGDGLVDEFDVEDCDCIPYACGTPTYNNCVDCQVIPPIAETWAVQTVWSAESPGDSDSQTPVVGDIDGDCVPEVLVIRRDVNQIFVINGLDGSIEYIIDTYGNDAWNAGSIAIADVDADGMGDVFVISNDDNPAGFRNKLFRYEFNGSGFDEVFVSTEQVGPYDNYDTNAGPRYSILTINLADVNSDGVPEAIMGNEIFNAVNGDFLGDGGAANSIGAQRAFVTNTDLNRVNAYPVVADVLPDSYCVGCGGLELIAGNMVYSINIPFNGGPNSATVNIEVDMSAQIEDGMVSIADVNFDGSLDVVSTQGNDTNGSYSISVWNPETSTLYDQLDFYQFDAIGPGRTAIANLDTDDSDMELSFHIGSNLYCYKFNSGSNTLSLLASTSVSDNSRTSVSVFDFNADGQNEIVYRDENQLRILRASDMGDMISPAYTCGSGTNVEYPIIADVNADGQTEILIACNSGLKLIGNAEPGTFWASARRVWNQFSYFYTNVNDDLTIPTQQQAGHLVGDSVVLNNFLKQYSNPQFPVADAVIEYQDAVCNGDFILANFEVCNEGDYDLPAGTPVSFYQNDPQSTVANLIVEHALSISLAPDSCAIELYEIPAVYNENIYPVINDDQSIPTPFDLGNDFPATNIPECNYENNIDTFRLDYMGEVLDLGPDIIVCDNGVFPLNAGSGFQEYRWFDGSDDSTYTAFLPGTYWVEVVDGCNNIQIDSLTISVLEETIVELGSDQSICPGDSVLLTVSGFDHYSWTPNDDLSCDDCPATYASPIEPTKYTLVATTMDGCISVDTVNVFMGDSILRSIDTLLCDESIFYYDNTPITAGTSMNFFHPSAIGCDTFIEVTVRESAGSFNALVDSTVCLGQTLLFNDVVFEPGADSTFYFQTFEGCDSIIRVIVEESPIFFLELDTAICLEESIAYLGEVFEVGTDTTFNLVSQFGCDSLVHLQVNELPQFATSIDTTICEGETLFIEGVNLLPGTDTIFAYHTIGACDSLIIVSVGMNQVFQQVVDTSLCEDESLFFAGLNFPVGTDTIFHFLTNENCDSTVLLSVDAFPNYDIFIDTFICENSFLILDSFEFEAGTDTILHLFTVDNCDSIIHVVVSELPTYEIFIDTMLCQGEYFVFGNTNIPSGIDTTFNLQTFQNCDSTINISVGALDTFFSVENILLCNGDSAFVFGVYESSPGSYSETYLSDAGCDSTWQIQIDVLPPLNVVFNTIPTCPQDSSASITAIVTGGQQPYEYAWSNGEVGENRLEDLPIGNFELSITDAQGCEFAAFINTEAVLSPIFNHEAIDVTCFGIYDGSILLDTFNTNFTFSLDGENFQQASTFNFLKAGAYDVFAMDEIGCVFSTELIINSPSPLDVALPDDMTIELGDSIVLNSQVNTFDSLSYQWNEVQWMSCWDCPSPLINPLETQYYELQVFNENDCSATDDVTIVVEKPERIYIPNAFSPNNDGINDIFMVFAGQDVKEILSFKIFDRWGELIIEHRRFQPNSPAKGWDGTFRNKPMDSGVFVYVIEVEFFDGNLDIYKGDVALIK